MKCDVSQTTFSADRAARVPGEGTGTREIDRAVEGVLFREVLQPLAKAMGFFGETVVDASVRSTLHERREVSS